MTLASPLESIESAAVQVLVVVSVATSGLALSTQERDEVFSEIGVMPDRRGELWRSGAGHGLD